MRLQNLFTALCVLALTQLTACITTAPTSAQKFTPVTNAGAENGVLYLYRPDRPQVRTTAPGILIDGKEFAALRNNTYIAIPLPPGDHTVDLKLAAGYRGNALIRVSIAKGESAFVRVVAEGVMDTAAQRFDSTFRIMTVEPSAGMNEIKDCNPETP